MSLNVHQASYELMRETLRGGLHAAIESGREGGGLASVQARASAALYTLLNDHRIDRRGRCRFCRRRGAVFGCRHRTCRVYLAARFYLHQPDDVLLWRLADELDKSDLSARDERSAESCGETRTVATGETGDSAAALPSGVVRRTSPDRGGAEAGPS